MPASTTVRALALLGLFAAGACSDPVQPGASLFAGRYDADLLEYVAEGGGAEDFLSNGSYVFLNIGRDGAFSATMRTPVALSGLNDVPLEVRGRWEASGDKLVLTGEPITFLNRLLISAEPDNVLYSEQTIQGALVRIRLVPSEQ